MPDQELSEVQFRIYTFIMTFKIQYDGIPPTVREIADKLNMGSTSIQYQLDNMERLGLIRRKVGRSRSIQLIGGKYVPPQWGG